MANSFANYNEPYINGSTLKRLYSSVVKENIFQTIFTRDGESCTEKYCEDTSVAQVTVLRILPGKGNPRSLVGTKNNGFFNADAAVINETESYRINLLDLVDYQVDIPEVQQDMMSTDLASARASILGGQVGRAVNAITIASQIAKNFNDIANSDITSNWISLPASPIAADYLSAVVSASAKLDDGNTELGIDTYPISERSLYVRSDFKSKLYSVGALIVGGSNDAQRMLKEGGISVGDKSDNVTGYSGRVLDVPVYMAGGAVWTMVEAYLGLDPAALSFVKAIMVSGIGTGRGLAFNATIKQIDSPNGAGVRMQPLYRFGAECWDGLSVVPIVTNGSSNIATDSANLTVMAPASRQTKLSFNANTGTGTITDITVDYAGTATVPASTGLTAPGVKTFSKWNTAAAGTGTDYAVGDSITVYAPEVLYAIWE